MNDLNILIVGVGGQGTLLASRFLGAAAALLGKDVKLPRYTVCPREAAVS